MMTIQSNLILIITKEIKVRKTIIEMIVVSSKHHFLLSHMGLSNLILISIKITKHLPSPTQTKIITEVLTIRTSLLLVHLVR